MIDKKHQRKGYGTSRAYAFAGKAGAMEKGHVPFYTSAKPENESAIAFYESMGFCNTGQLLDGEILLIREL